MGEKVRIDFTTETRDSTGRVVKLWLVHGVDTMNPYYGPDRWAACCAWKKAMCVGGRVKDDVPIDPIDVAE